MKVKDLIHELYYFNDSDDIFALYYDKEKDVEYECNIEVRGDAVSYTHLTLPTKA